MLIELRDVFFSYLSHTPFQVQALEGISLSIHRGESIGIVGRTGCGKSTLAQHLNGLLLPEAGQVLVNGIDTRTRGAASKDIRKKVGLVFQYPEDQFFEESVFKEIAFAPRNMGIEGKELEEKVQWAMEMVGLDFTGLKDKSPFELSGGQMRRVAIASILSMQPEVLVLDEPTAGLDPQGKRLILGKLQELREKHGLTLVIISHSMEDLARIVERIIIMDRGKIAFDGSIRQAFSQGDFIKQFGILPPVVSQVASLLRSRGFPVNPEVLTPAELAEEIRVKVMEKKERGSCWVEA
jgi:energy-coupling factor transport system ATP-binding protein